MFQEFALGIHEKAVLDPEPWDCFFHTHEAFPALSAQSAHLPLILNLSHQSYIALQELTRQDSDSSNDQTQVCSGPWTMPPSVSPHIQAQ